MYNINQRKDKILEEIFERNLDIKETWFILSKNDKEK